MRNSVMCPLTKSHCTKECAWFVGECAISYQAYNLTKNISELIDSLECVSAQVIKIADSLGEVVEPINISSEHIGDINDSIGALKKCVYDNLNDGGKHIAVCVGD